jgi:hypothetical protein
MSSRLASPSCPYAAGSARNLDHPSQPHQKKGTSPPRQEIRCVQPSRWKRACSRLASSGRFVLGAGIEPLCSKTTLCPTSVAPPNRSCSPSPSPLPLLWPEQGREAPLVWTIDVLATQLPIASPSGGRWVGSLGEVRLEGEGKGVAPPLRVLGAALAGHRLLHHPGDVLLQDAQPVPAHSHPRGKLLCKIGSARQN